MARILKGDLVKIISGKDKGRVGKVEAVLPKKNAVLVENMGKSTRKIRPSQFNPQGGIKDIHVPIPLHKVALVVDEKKESTSRVGYVDQDGKTVRVARQQNNKEIK